MVLTVELMLNLENSSADATNGFRSDADDKSGVIKCKYNRDAHARCENNCGAGTICGVVPRR